MAFDAKHKKAVASDTKLATTMEHPANFEDSNFSLAVQKLPVGNAVHKRACQAILCRMMIIKKLSDDCTNFIICISRSFKNRTI